MSDASWFENFAKTDDDSSMKAPSIVATDTSLVNVKQEPASESTLSRTVTPRHSVIGITSDLTKTQLCAAVSARDYPVNNEEYVRAPVDIVVALDLSASMNGDKLSLCKESLELLINALLPGDRFGLVTFSDTAEVEMHIQELTEELKEHAVDLVKSLSTKNRTNIADGVCTALNELQSVLPPNSVRTVFLLTDGLANQGVTYHGDLVRLAKMHCAELESIPAPVDDESESSWVDIPDAPPEEQFKRPPPITIHCFGYGSDHDSRMLQGISEATSGGSYYFVENDEDVITAFGDALGGVFSVVAQHVVLTITVPPESRALGVDIVKVYHKNKAEHKDKTYSISLGDFYAEESRDILFEVSLARSPSCTVDYWITHATVSISYVDVLSNNKFVSRQPVPCGIARISGSAVSAADRHVKVQWLRVRVTETIRHADKLAAKGNVREAQMLIHNMLEAIQLSTDDVRSDELVRQLCEDLHRCQDGLVSYAAYTRHGSHTMRNTFQSHSTQRCMDSLGTARRNVYRGSHKAKTIQAFQSR